MDTQLASTQIQQKTVPGLCSVVCTTYNHADFSRAAIESIIAQDYRPIEIVVIDDGSTDGNTDIIRSTLEGRDVQYTVIDQENTGNVGMNANRGIRAAKGDVVLLMSLDDILLPSCISSKMKLFLEDRSLAMVGNSTNAEIDNNGKIIVDSVPNSVFGKENVSAAELREVEYTNVGTFFLQGTAFRADVLSAIGGFDEDMTGDDLILRTKIWNYFIDNPELHFYFLRQAGFCYRKQPHNLHRNVLRQIRTVLDWRGRFFPNRPLPEVSKAWIIDYIKQRLKVGDYEAVNTIVAEDSEIYELFNDYRSTWQYRRRAIKSAVKRFIRAKRVNVKT